MATKKILLSELETVSYGTHIPKSTEVVWRCNWGERYVEKWPANNRDVRFGFKVPPYVKSFTTNFNFKQEGTSMGSNTIVYFSALTQPLDILKTTTFVYPTENTLSYHMYRPIPTDLDGKIAHIYSNVSYNANGYSIKCVGSDTDIGMTYYDYAYITAEYDEVGASNLTVSGNSIDSNIVVSWQSNFQDSATVNIKNSTGTTVAIKAVTTDKSVTFTPGSITTTGDFTVEVIASYKTLPETLTSKISLTKVIPTIASLEPDNVNQNIDNNITISWISTNQTAYKLEIDGTAYTGTTQKSVIIPGGTLKEGIKNIKLIVYHTSSWGELRTVEKTVSFLGYGKPQTPTLNLKTIYSTATPTLNWTSSGQVAYRIIIKKNSTTVLDTDEIISSNQFYNISSALENNTTYTVSLIIKNQFNLWSAEAIGTFITQFTVLSTPNLIATSEDSGAIILKLNTNSENAAEYKCSEIWRREPYGEWKRMAYDLGIDTVYRDFYIASDVEYEYKARNIATSGGISESDVIKASSKVKYYTLFDIADTTKSITFKNDVVITPKYNQNISSNLFAGNEKPTTEIGNEGYFDATISFKTRDRSLINKLINLVRTSKVLLFKDSRGHKWFGNIIGNLEFPETNLGIITITLQFLETNFLEQDVYSGNNSLYLLKFDGTWMFDGTKTFNGVG